MKHITPHICYPFVGLLESNAQDIAVKCICSVQICLNISFANCFLYIKMYTYILRQAVYI